MTNIQGRQQTVHHASSRLSEAPLVSAILCTRNRPEDLARCLPTLLANDYENFEIVIVDQSTNDASRAVVEQFHEPVIRYVASSLEGKSRAVNTAVAHARSEILVMTDDDCTVPADWISRIAGNFANDPQIDIVFGALVPIPHDPCVTIVPAFLPKRRTVIRDRSAPAHRLGVGGNMAFRRAIFERVGGFDESMGTGSTFRSADDTEFTYRALRAGSIVVQDPEITAEHWGAREFAGGGGARLICDGYFGVGASYARHARLGDALAAFHLAREIVGGTIEMGRNLHHREGIRIGRRLAWLALGAMRGLVGKPSVQIDRVRNAAPATRGVSG